jgi:hypothetical protein
MAEPAKTLKPCPTCGKPAIPAREPFCSKRCADIDLNRWLSGAYAIPGQPDDDPAIDPYDRP